MPPQPGLGKRVGRPSKYDDDALDFSINDNEFHDELDEDLPNPFTLPNIDIDPYDPSASHTGDPLLGYDGVGSKKNNKLKKSSSQLDQQPHSAISPLTLSFASAVPTFDQSLSEINSRGLVQSVDHDTLKSLAKELHIMQRESKQRAFQLESELRSYYKLSSSETKLESESYYQKAMQWLHGIDVSDDPLGDEGALTFTLSICRDTNTKRRKKGDQKSQAADAVGGLGDDGELDASANKPKKQTAKEKQSELKQFHEDVESYMTFPAEPQCNAVMPATQSMIDTYLTIPQAGEHYLKKELELKWKEEREIDKLKYADSHSNSHGDPYGSGNGSLNGGSTPELSKSERKKKDKKKDKEKRDRDRLRETKRWNEAQRLQLPYIDAKLRKSVIEMDKLLASENGSVGKATYSSALFNRLLACIIETPTVTNNGQPVVMSPVHRPYPVGPILCLKAKKKKRQLRQSMSMDEKLKLEFRSIGMNHFAIYDLDNLISERIDDQVSAELRAAQSELLSLNDSVNPTKSLFYPLGLKISDHTQRLAGLNDAESQLNKTYKKKKLSENACQKALEMYGSAETRYGKRRQITGFIPHPRDMGGVPRAIADRVTNHPSYIQVFMSQTLNPLTGNANNLISVSNSNSNLYNVSGSYRSSYGHKSLPLPSLSAAQSYSPSPMPASGSGMTGLTQQTYASPLPSFSSATSPLRLSPSGGVDGANLNAGEGENGLMDGTDEFGLGIGKMPAQSQLQDGIEAEVGFF